MDSSLVLNYSATLYSVFEEHASVLKNLTELGPHILQAVTFISDSLRNGGKILLCGNGGSAADAQHIAGEFIGRFLRERHPWPAIALNTNTSALTAIGNDYAFDEAFARQVLAHGRDNDVLMAISTSGNSRNILRAAQCAREKSLKVIGLTGDGGGQLKEFCDVCISVPSVSTPRIQEMHILIGHLICQLVDDALC